MAPGRRKQCQSAGTQASVPGRIANPSEIGATQTDVSSQPITDSSVASSYRRVRGRVVGHESKKRMRILGSRIYVPLGAQSRAFEGINASTFAIKLGNHIRRLVPLNKETWGAVDDGCKEAIFTAAARKSQRNSESRSKVKMLHTAGSRSFAAQFSIMQADEQQAPPSQPELYHQQHYSKKKNRWNTDHAEETHRKMEEALSQLEINSPVAEQRVIENLLGKRVARRQGYRSRGLSSSSTGSLMSSEVSTLRQQLADSLKAQEELREELRRQYEDSQKQMQDQAAMQVHMQS